MWSLTESSVVSALMSETAETVVSLCGSATAGGEGIEDLLVARVTTTVAVVVAEAEVLLVVVASTVEAVV